MQKQNKRLSKNNQTNQYPSKLSSYNLTYVTFPYIVFVLAYNTQ